MIRTILTFRLPAEDVEAVERIYAHHDVLGYSLEQTRGEVSELAVAVDGDDDDDEQVEVVVTATWPDEQAYQEWLDHPRRGAVAEGLPEIVGPVGSARVYEVRQRATARPVADGGRQVDRNLELTSPIADGDLSGM
ncbi:hypothetical protein [Aeromicrobium sp. CTD01-1L150]|uniref:hypothetical protein n=1 Tax=Aeromicrobium sp. CTD01-1L150 TaxID=3341830 RepID=UPI0035C1E0C2